MTVSIFSSSKIIISRVFVFLVSSSLITVAQANPVINNVISGNVTIQQNGNTVQINQTTARGIIAWDSFNIGANEKTQFNQPNASAVTLNRINPAQGASLIFGQLSANGKIILINGAGLYFANSALVNVGSIIASTSNISNANFLADKYIFDEPSIYHGSVVNKGMITSADFGVIALLGAVVENDGLIRAHLGTVALGSGSQFTLDFNGDQLITFAVTSPAAHGSVTNSGKIMANGGQVYVTAAAAQGVLDNVINMSGYVEARSARTQNGSIVLLANNGNIVVSGKLNVSGTLHNGSAGKVSISGDNIVLTKTAKVIANARERGNGGAVTIKAVNAIQNVGTIVAQGGGLFGDGGSVETSGAILDVSSGKVNLTAAQGHTGTWLIDPSDLTISNNASSHVDITSNTTEANQTTSTQMPNLNVADLEYALNTANIIVQTSINGAGGAGDINVLDNLSWASNHSLTLSAYHNININDGVAITNTGGALVTLRADNAALGAGTVNFNGTGKVNLTAGGAVDIFYNPSSYSAPTDYSHMVNGVIPTAYMLVNSSENLAAIQTNLSGNYALGKDITVSTSFTPIGHVMTPFTGQLNGLNHTIDGLQIVNATPNADVGLFGYTDNAVISNIKLTNVNITETSNPRSVGMLVGFALNTQFHNVSASGEVEVDTHEASGTMSIGGLVGFLQGSYLLNHSSSAGFISVLTNTPDYNSLNVGGLVGATVYNGQPQPYAINNVYSSTVLLIYGVNKGAVNAGGLIGANGADGAHVQGANISDSYSTGYVNMSVVNADNGVTNVGGFIGLQANNNLMRANFWDTESSAQSEAHGVGNIIGVVDGLSAGCYSGYCGAEGGSAKLSVASNYTQAGWNMDATWGIQYNNSYPHLKSLDSEISIPLMSRSSLRLNVVNFSQSNNLVFTNTASDEIVNSPLSSDNGDITIEMNTANGMQTSSKQQLDQNDLAILRSYTNYVNNVPPTSPATAVYAADNIVVQQVASNCSSTNQSASVDMENNITLSEGCAP